jgi:hypothetical protein
VAAAVGCLVSHIRTYRGEGRRGKRGERGGMVGGERGGRRIGEGVRIGEGEEIEERGGIHGGKISEVGVGERD